MEMLSTFPDMKTDSSASRDAEWLRQFDVSLPGCTLRKQVDIMALIKQVSLPICFLEFLFIVIVCCA